MPTTSEMIQQILKDRSETLEQIDAEGRQRGEQLAAQLRVEANQSALVRDLRNSRGQR